MSAQRSTRSDGRAHEVHPSSHHEASASKIYSKHGVLTRHAAAASAYRVGNANPQARRAAPISTSRRMTADPRRFAPGCSHRGLPRPMEPEQLSIGITATGQPVHFSREERERHVYVVGKSGSGKSTLLFNLAMLDIMAGKGVAIIDPHATWRKWSPIACRVTGHTKLATST
jgi:ABC-type glutathione transport system ATPase component